MSDSDGILVSRFAENPLISPGDVMPSRPDHKVVGVFNPGAFILDDRIFLLVRVAECPLQKPGKVRFPAIVDGHYTILEVEAQDPDLDVSDPREFRYKGVGYISSISHLRLFVSDDGRKFGQADAEILRGIGPRESYGIEDARVTQLEDGRFMITYTAVSACGYGIGARLTSDWRTFGHLDLIFTIPNKDCAIFPGKLDEMFCALNRPSGVIVGGHDIWLSRSPDLRHWGNHRCIARVRPGNWDSSRIGANGPPILTDEGWLVLYHGADETNHYRLGAIMLDASNPEVVLARTNEPLFEPEKTYETDGFLKNVVFSNGHIRLGDSLFIYYGAGDSVTCGASVSIAGLIKRLEKSSCA